MPSGRPAAARPRRWGALPGSGVHHRRWLVHLSAEVLAEEALGAQGAGFRGAKVKVGKETIGEDVSRLNAVRAAVGPDWHLMVDANQAFRVDEAVRRAAAYADLGLTWFEEPMPADDVVGHAQLASRTTIPVAVGESLYSLRHFRDYLHLDATSILQVDAARIGGITPWLKVAHLAEAYNVSVAPHFLMELHVSLAAAVAAGTWVEYIPQLDPVTTSRLTIEDGFAVAPTTQGLGIDWDDNAIAARAQGRWVVGPY